MEFPSWMIQLHRQTLVWWVSLGPDGPYYAWLIGGALIFSIWAWVSYRILRRLTGHRKLRGAWYNDAQYRKVMQLLHEDQQAGQRVLSYEEVAALRKYRYGDTVQDVMRHKGTGYFS